MHTLKPYIRTSSVFSLLKRASRVQWRQYSGHPQLSNFARPLHLAINPMCILQL
jgi:hypothetical protein